MGVAWHEVAGMEQSGRHGGQNRTLSSHLNFKHEVEKQREQTESGVKLYNLKPCPQ